MTAQPNPTAIVTRAQAGRRPLLSAREQECLVLLLNINGLEVLTLFDTGSTTELVSSDFARVARCDVFELENLATLQLGCAGSSSRIDHGARAPTTLGQFWSQRVLRCGQFGSLRRGPGHPLPTPIRRTPRFPQQ
ncbi:hypothetical protein OH77DRAFT_598412 [Trametes cingulata]|nr:hypothetical protein OH77DRAFT_598412 [Trametes cingulata]